MKCDCDVGRGRFAWMTYHSISGNIEDSYRGCQIKDVKLKQQPTETLDVILDVYCSKELNYLAIKVNLDFHNSLHKLTQDYSYDVLVQARVRDKKNNKERCIIFFCSERRRFTNRVSFFEKYKFSSSSEDAKLMQQNLVHVCVGISRTNPPPKTNPVVALEEQFLKSNVWFHVGNEIFAAHDSVLSAVSEVFKKMFSHRQNGSHTKQIIIKEFDAEVVKELLNYVYSRKMENLDKTALDLISLAHAYEMQDLVLQCEEQILFNIDRYDVSKVIQLSHSYSLKRLKEAATNFKTSEETHAKIYKDYLQNGLRIETLNDVMKLCHDYDLDLIKSEAAAFVREESAKLPIQRALKM